MAGEYRTKESINAILVHRLPPDVEMDALTEFPRGSIVKWKQAVEGLQIYFKNYDYVRESVLKCTVIVRGQSYKIYPMVTNLTVCGIAPYSSKATLWKVMSSYGFILNLYPIQEETGDNLKLLDYRIILDVPEIFADFTLLPVKVPNLSTYFKVLFFCRLCRQNGHKQYKCQAGNCGGGFWKKMPFNGESPEIMLSQSSEGSHVDNSTANYEFTKGLPNNNFMNIKLEQATCSMDENFYPTYGAPIMNENGDCNNNIDGDYDYNNENEHTREFDAKPIEDQLTETVSRTSQSVQTSNNGTNVMNPRKKSCLYFHMCLSKGIMSAIRKTSGILKPRQLCDFLHNVRGRQKMKTIEMANIFTKGKVSLLAKQLGLVYENYYSSLTKKGPEEENDIRVIYRVYKALCDIR